MSHEMFNFFVNETSGNSNGSGRVHVIELLLPLSLDVGQFDSLNEQLGQIVDEQPHARWVVDLSGVENTGSSVLGLLVNLRQKVKQGRGSLVLCRLSERLQKTMSTC